MLDRTDVKAKGLADLPASELDKLADAVLAGRLDIETASWQIIDQLVSSLPKQK